MQSRLLPDVAAVRVLDDEVEAAIVIAFTNRRNKLQEVLLLSSFDLQLIR